jgi:hypothetical protein
MGNFMKIGNNSRQILAGLTFGFLVVTGTYNAIVINSESAINGSNVRFAKRLDEVYGVIVSKREVAASMQWQKLSIKQASVVRAQIAKADKVLQPNSVKDEAPVEVVAEAAVKEDLNLSLTGVINPKKWQQGLNNTQFSGSLETNQGVIESLNASLPNGEGVSVSFSEMTGNVFEYDFNGELYSGMMYQESEQAYVVTLTNGPLEGTRMTFTGQPSQESLRQQEDQKIELAQSSDAEAGYYQEQVPAVAVAQDVQEVPVQDPYTQNLADQDLYAQEQGVQDQAMNEGGTNTYQ